MCLFNLFGCNFPCLCLNCFVAFSLCVFILFSCIFPVCLTCFGCNFPSCLACFVTIFPVCLTCLVVAIFSVGLACFVAIFPVCWFTCLLVLFWCKFTCLLGLFCYNFPCLFIWLKFSLSVAAITMVTTTTRCVGPVTSTRAPRPPSGWLAWWSCHSSSCVWLRPTAIVVTAAAGAVTAAATAAPVYPKMTQVRSGFHQWEREGH